MTGLKPGTRALGVAESYTEDTSTLAGVVVRADRVVDGVVFESCTVGGTDATDAVVSLFDRLDRDDVRYLVVAGIAPAWFNVVDLNRLYEQTGVPALSVTFEESDGLEATIEEEFDDEDAHDRLETYRTQPARHPVSVDDETIFVRSVGIDDDGTAHVVRAFTPEGGRPEPVRVARLVARAGDAYRRL